MCLYGSWVLLTKSGSGKCYFLYYVECVLVNKLTSDFIMDIDRPPEPPDPGGSDQSISTETSSRKRSGDKIVSSDSGKRTVIHPTTANPSIQTVYINPSFVDGPKNYTADDKGPYIVHVSREISDPASGTSIRAIKFGQFLHTHKIPSIINDGVKNIGRNRIEVKFSSAQAANSFISNPVLQMCKYKANLPTYNVTRMGLVRGIPVDWSMEEILQSIELPQGCGEIVKMRRLNRKSINEGVVSWIPTQAVVINFKGQILPSKIYSFHTSLPVETYNLPTIICLNCCRYGHIKTQCRSTPRCFKCSKSHSGDSCDVTKDNSTCLHCTGTHFATDRDCPEFSRQHSIKVVMSQDNISYIEAASRFPNVRRSYAEVAKEMFSPPTYSPSSPPKPSNPPS